MPRDAVSRTANVERTGRHKWVNTLRLTLPRQTNRANKYIELTLFFIALLYYSRDYFIHIKDEMNKIIAGKLFVFI